MKPMRIWPSVLAADLADLAGAARSVASAVHGLHVDMMDGRFVPNLTMGPPVLAALRRHTDLPLEAHLMVEAPDDLLDDLAAAGATRVVVHAEATRHLQRTLSRIRALGMEAGLALNPATALGVLDWLVADLDMVLVMTVNPGFGGQSAIPAALGKVAAVRTWAAGVERPDLPVGVDGGMDLRTAPVAAALGATDIVAGTSVFGAPDPAAAAAALLAACADNGSRPGGGG